MFSEDGHQIVAMKSLEGEVVPLTNAVTVTTDVEVHPVIQNVKTHLQ